jgi:hypothetical protein
MHQPVNATEALIMLGSDVMSQVLLSRDAVVHI